MNFAHSRSGVGLAKLLITTGVAVYAGAALGQAPDPLTPEPEAMLKVRFISLVVPATSAGTNTAIRVRLAALNHPTIPPPGSPDFTLHEGTFRYVNSFGGSVVCVDSSTFATNYRCGQLGCEPEYRDWATDLAVETNPASPVGLIHVTGNAVVPSSVYEADHIAEGCGFGVNADECADASDVVSIGTAAWGDIGSGAGGPSDGVANVIDVGLSSDNQKGGPLAQPEYRGWLKHGQPNPWQNPYAVIDIGLAVDAAKGLPYAYSISGCP